MGGEMVTPRKGCAKTGNPVSEQWLVLASALNHASQPSWFPNRIADNLQQAENPAFDAALGRYPNGRALTFLLRKSRAW